MKIETARRHRTAGGNGPAQRFDRRQRGQFARTVDMYFKQTTQQFAQIRTAARRKAQADEVRRVAHSCAGASATLGMTRLVPVAARPGKDGRGWRVDGGRPDLRRCRTRICGGQRFSRKAAGFGRNCGRRGLNMKKILIIEDDQIVSNVYRNKLAVEGYKAETAPDGETGLKSMRTFKPDTIILDLMLPGISGLRRHQRNPHGGGIFKDSHHRLFQHLPDQPDSGGVEGGRDQMPFQVQLLAQGSD